MKRYLVVANQTLGSDQLYEKVRRCRAEGPCAFHIVVPATPPTEHLTWTEGEAQGLARDRLVRAIDWFRDLGASVDGEVGDANPLLAIWDVVSQERFDEIVLSTLPSGISRWLRMDLPSRARAMVDVPVFHIVAEMERHGAA
jgi:hypothetical protein